MQSVSLNKVKLHAGTYDNFLSEIISLSRKKTSSYVCFANAHMLVEAWTDSNFANTLNDSTLVCPDGKPLAILISRLLKIHQDRVCGMDIVPHLIANACEEKLKIYFVGPDVETVSSIKKKIAFDFPESSIVAGSFIPPVRPDSCCYDDDIIKSINESAANLVFVSLGCPKQERWMQNHYREISAPLLGVGGALPVYAGLQKRAPNWMQRYALEWLFRLFIEPRRLFKRYFITNSLFIYNALKILASKNVISSHDDSSGME